MRWWLLSIAALIAIMVLVGGATRLTELGLSIVEWKPVTGTPPPLSQQQWTDAFEAYKKIPQYRELNAGMSLDQFKTIFWWEWSHRLLGRVIGAAYLLPFLWFLWRGAFSAELKRRLWLIFGLGALQGAVGWWMVASGLTQRTEVSQVGLATHLVLALLIFAGTAGRWAACGLGRRMFPRGCGVTSVALLTADSCTIWARWSPGCARQNLQHLARDRRRADSSGRGGCSRSRGGAIVRQHRSRCSSNTGWSPMR